MGDSGTCSFGDPRGFFFRVSESCEGLNLEAGVGALKNVPCHSATLGVSYVRDVWLVGTPENSEEILPTRWRRKQLGLVYGQSSCSLISVFSCYGCFGKFANVLELESTQTRGML